MQGKIIKGIAGFYYVSVAGSGIYECRARGLFRKEGQKPMVGDNADIEILSEEPKEGNVTGLLQRKNMLIRPAVANVDAALVIFAAAQPKPQLNLLDRFLVMMEFRHIPAAVCINKVDLDTEYATKLASIYKNAGYPVFLTSAAEKTGIRELEGFLKNKTVTAAGPSGVGKSSLINLLQSDIHMETGRISDKIERGRHTTRHSELIRVSDESFIMDTPGFSSLYLDFIDADEVRDCFPEFRSEEQYCRFSGCMHIEEPDCGVREAVAQGRISSERYENYIEIYTSRKERRRY